MENASIQTISPLQSSLPPATELFKRAVSFYKLHWKIILGIAVVPVIFSLPQTIFQENLHPILLVVLFILAVVIGFFSRLALFDAVIEGGEPQDGVKGAYRKGFKIFVPFLWVSALVSFSVLGGFFIFFVPGILLSTWLSMSIYAFLAEDKRGLSALAVSWYYVKGNWLPVFWRFLYFGIVLTAISFVFLFVTSLLFGGLTLFSMIRTGQENLGELSRLSSIVKIISDLFYGLLVTPLSIIYPYGVYRALRDMKPVVGPEEEAKIKKTTAIFVFIGIAGLLILLAIGAFLAIKFLPQFFQEFTPKFDPTPASPQNLSSAIFAFMGFAPFLEFLSFGK